MRPIYHIAISGGLALAQWRLTGNRAAAGWTFVSGTLIDLDHMPDYLAAAGKDQIRLTFVLHSWEIWGPLAAVALVRGGPAGLLKAVGSPVLHMLLDVWGNRVPFRFFSFIWRARRGFLVQAIRPEGDRKKFPTDVHEIPHYVARSFIGPLRRPPR